MNRRERRWGRTMYLLPLMLVLTAIALLPLEWVLRINDFHSFGILRQSIKQSLPALIFPLILMVLFICRPSPKIGYILTLVCLAITLGHLICLVLYAKEPVEGFLTKIPGYDLFASITAVRAQRNIHTVLRVSIDGAMFLSTFSSVFGCLIYAWTKQRSERRNAEFDRQARAKGYYIPGKPVPRDEEAWQSDWQAPVPAVPEENTPETEPTRVISTQDIAELANAEPDDELMAAISHYTE